MLSVSLFDFDLPDELIARYPAERRDGSRMLVVDRATGEFEIRPFSALPEYLTAGDALLCNDALVRRARMFGRKEGREDGAKFEILLLAPDTDGLWNVMLKPGKRALPGTKVAMMTPEGAINTYGDFFTVVAKNDDNSYKIEFSDPSIEKFEMRYGHIPLPPYLNREAEAVDLERYQTVYAKVPGAVAAPTAGLHFTPEILDILKNKGETVVVKVNPALVEANKEVDVFSVDKEKVLKGAKVYLLPDETLKRSKYIFEKATNEDNIPNGAVLL